MKKVRVDISESLKNGLVVLAFDRGLSVNQYAKNVVLSTIRGELAMSRSAAAKIDPVPAQETQHAEKRGIDVDFLLDDDDYRALDNIAFNKDMRIGEYLFWLLSVHVFGFLHTARIARSEPAGQGK